MRIISTITARITRIDETANAAVIESAEPDRYRASISSGSVKVSPLVFERALTAPNSPSALAAHIAGQQEMIA